MRKLLVGLLVLGSFSSFAYDECRDPKLATKSLNSALKSLKSAKRCDDDNCARERIEQAQEQLCDAATACEEIGFTLYYPCEQQLVISDMEGEELTREVPQFLKGLIKKAKKEI